MRKSLINSKLNEMEEIRKISIESGEYPEALRKIKNPPKAIYFKGKLFPKENCFAVVGTRKCSFYGKQAAIEFSEDLSAAGLTIVSGLAPGIDTFAHKAAVEKERRTIAVLGTGLDKKNIYPKENLKLSGKIIEKGGCLISEYPPGTPGSKFSFPQRNRIISGLSLGLLVIEAKIKSGSLITASWAKKQKKKVFAVPGSIYSLNSKGTHKLIKEGAELAESTEGILEKINFFSRSQEKNAENPREEKSPVESLILNALKAGSLDIEKIIEKTGLPAPAISSALAILEIKKDVKNLGGNTYAISNR